MNRFTESNITLTFPDRSYFRLSDCTGYKKLSSFHFKEMDVSWYNQSEEKLWLIELKDYTSISNEQIDIESRVNELVKKSVDALSMMLCVKHGYAMAAEFDCIVPINLDGVRRLSLLNVIHLNQSQQTNAALINERYKQKFKAYATLFNISYFGVMSSEQARRKITEFTVQ